NAGLIDYKNNTKCPISLILPQPLLHCYIRFWGIIQHIYLSVLSENSKPRFARELLYSPASPEPSPSEQS
ncbi:hypothetical protein, partial [Dialister hominis]|uniref:hypothetical protein n=1 Tax=Dialister hominis TaxID=2582419 RepID=UPI003FD8ACA9